MDIQSTFIIGRLTREPEVTYTSGGVAIMNFSIATNHRKSKDGTEEVSYFNCKAFGKLAENLKPYMGKGKQLAIKGFLKQERWEKDGQKNSRIVINCDEIELLGGATSTNNPNNVYDENGDLPF